MTAFKASRRSPSISTVTDDPRSHTLALQQIVESLDIANRRTKDITNSFVRIQDLIDIGLIEVVDGKLKRVV